jgi:hypothetical protein
MLSKRSSPLLVFRVFYLDRVLHRMTAPLAVRSWVPELDAGSHVRQLAMGVYTPCPLRLRPQESFQ